MMVVGSLQPRSWHGNAWLGKGGHKTKVEDWRYCWKIGIYSIVRFEGREKSRDEMVKSDFP